jgi:hypothetical protein
VSKLPESLSEAIKTGLQRMTDGELGCGCAVCNEIEESVRLSVTCFVLQKISDHLFTSNPDVVRAMSDLWSSIRTKPEPKEILCKSCAGFGDDAERVSCDACHGRGYISGRAVVQPASREAMAAAIEAVEKRAS